MPTSGLNTFNLDIEQIIKQASVYAGSDISTAKDLKEARTALSLLLIDLQNRGHPLAELQNKTLTTVSNTAAYTLSAGITDVLDVVVIPASSSTATPLNRISLFEYHKIPNKGAKATPSQYTVDRGRDSITMYLYQTPDKSTYTIDYWCLTEIEDVGVNYSNNLDVNKKYLPAITFGLAYFMALGRKPDNDMTLQDLVQKRSELKGLYEQLLPAAALEDAERVSLRFTPHPYGRK